MNQHFTYSSYVKLLGANYLGGHPQYASAKFPVFKNLQKQIKTLHIHSIVWEHET